MIVKLVLLFLFLPIGIVGLIMTISDFDGINLFLTIIGLIIGITVARSLFQDVNGQLKVSIFGH
jgi:hypothetical protein